jgi:hypothetical protein
MKRADSGHGSEGRDFGKLSCMAGRARRTHFPFERGTIQRKLLSENGLSDGNVLNVGHGSIGIENNSGDAKSFLTHH